MLDDFVNIIWLSDIHFKAEYIVDKKYINLNKYISSFHKYVTKIKNKNKYDYILISGDIAQSASKVEYDLFIQRIFKDLSNSFINAKLLIVPGNHDVNRLHTAKLKKLFTNNISNINKKQFLKSNKIDFFKLFENYYNSFKNFNLPTVDSDLKNNNLLYGYTINKEKRILFILLNSAWYSIGNSFLKYYLDERVFKINYNSLKEEVLNDIKNEFKGKSLNINDFSSSLTKLIKDKTYIADDYYIKKFISSLIKDKIVIEKSLIIDFDTISNKVINFIKNNIVKEIEHISNEYGKQLIGLDVFEKEFLKIKKLYETYNDYVVTTIMHHPISWLDWEERIPYEDKNNQISNFHDIKNFTDLLLTGHEHVPLLHKTEMINNNELLHIPAGCFMNASNPVKFKANNNWFSTLSINVNKRTVNQTKHFYDSYKWKSEVLQPIKLNKKHNTTLSVNRKKTIKSDSIDYKKLINPKLYAEIEIPDLGYYKLEDNLYTYVKMIDDVCFGLCFLVLKDLIIKNKIKKVHFILLDLNHKYFNDYLNPNNQKLVVLDRIKRDFDFKFDKFRDNFFSSLNAQEVVAYEKIKFKSTLKPYWQIETCLKL